MATKKPAPKAIKAEKPEKAPKAATSVKAAPAKAEPKAAKAPAKPAAKAKPEPKVAPVKAMKTAKAPVKAEAKAEAKPEPKAAAKKAARPAKAEAVATPLIPEAVAEAKAEPKAEPKAAGKGRKAAASEAAPAAVATVAPPASGEPPIFTPHAATVLAAIGAGQAIELIFLDDAANPPRTFEPRRLIFDVFTRAWFAWGWDRRYNAERHHRLDLLKEINPVEGPGRAAQGPFKDGTPANQIGGWLGGEPIPVKAMLMKQWIFAVKQAPAPFPDFHMEDAADGKAMVTFTATDLRAIARWCMQFGDGIQVLEPQRLVDRIKQVGVAWGGKPVAAAPAPAPKPPPPPPPARHEREHRREESREHRREEHRRDEPRRDEPRREHRERDREREAPKDEGKGKPGKVEVRVERL